MVRVSFPQAVEKLEKPRFRLLRVVKEAEVMSELMLLLAVLGALYKLSTLKSIYIEFGGRKDEEPKEPRQIKPERRKRQLKG